MSVRHPLILLPLIFMMANASTSAYPQPLQAASYLQDPQFFPAFNMYWRARVISRDAGNRLCSLPEVRYDDPKSPYRPIDERLSKAGRKFETLFPKALNTVARPYQIAPSQMLCSDEKAAWEALFAFETAVVALENLLENASTSRR